MATAQAAPPVTPIEQRGYAHPEVLVSTDWVAQHLNDPKVRLVESNEDILLYDTGHIPGAVKIDWTTDLNDPLIRDYLDQSRMQALLRSKGINSDTTRSHAGEPAPRRPQPRDRHIARREGEHPRDAQLKVGREPGEAEREEKHSGGKQGDDRVLRDRRAVVTQAEEHTSELH